MGGDPIILPHPLDLPGKGLAAYNAPASLVSDFLEACKNRRIDARHIPLSRLDAFRLPIEEETPLTVIHQDLPRDAFFAQAGRAANLLVYPLWFRRQRVCFFSRLDKSEHLHKPITAHDIHHNLAAVTRFLHAEQIVRLLDRANPANPNRAAAVPPTPLIPLDPYLDENQARAAGHIRGPIRVLAPAGSGKTRTLTNRITNLINHGVPGGRILALAFNRKAMQEMNERLAARGVTGVNVRTFHSFGYEIARQAGWHYDEATRQTTLRQLLRQAVERHATLPAHGKDPLAPYLAALRRAKLELPPLAEITVRQDGKRVPFAPIFETFLGLQTRRRALNFTDMIYQAIRALLDDDALRDAVQNQFEYVLVDEFQDLNKAQMLLLQILALPENNLFVVGDDDQMIYGWRGAEVRHILDFPKRYPTAETVILGINYRSARKIVNHSRWLIGHNPERVGKNIQARQPAPSEGTGRGLLDIRLHDGVREQATGAAAWIASQKEAHGLEWDDFAVLYRANDDARNVIPALEKQGIPYAHAEESSLNGEDLPDGEDPPDGEGLPDTPQPGAVSLMSVHKAKGKEFPYVVYFNLSRGTAMVETRAPEERRVAYVGVTRAQRGLLITADRGWPSPFVKELAINPEFDDFARVYLERQAAIARKNRDRIAKTIKTRERKRDALLRKFPELTGGPAPAGWRRKRRAAAAARTIQKLGAEIEDRQAKFPLALDRLDAIETEIRFRKLLGVKDKI